MEGERVIDSAKVFMIQGLSRIFLPVPCKKGRLKRKWSEIPANGPRCLSFLKECPMDPLKVTEVNQIFLGALSYP